MEISQSYLNNVAILKELSPTSGRQAYQAQYKDDFEKVYEQATKADVKLSTAKEFLNSLSLAELNTLQKYDSLADPIDVNSLSDEGAYNLIMHDYEKYDFNNDGFVQDGAAKMMGMIPTGMDESTKKAFVKSMNALSDEERINATGMFLSLPADPSSTEASRAVINYDEVAKRVFSALNPPSGGYSSLEFKAFITRFWEEFKNNYYS